LLTGDGTNAATPATVTGSFSVGGITASDQAAATGYAVKAELANAIEASLNAAPGGVTIDSLVAHSTTPTPPPTPYDATRRRRSSVNRRLQPSAAQRRLATFKLEVKFTATFATKADSDSALEQLESTNSRANVALSIQASLRGSTAAASFDLSGVRVRDCEAKEKKEKASGCARLSGTARELCEKAANTKAIVAGGIAAAVVFLAILAKCWHKIKYQAPEQGKPAPPVIAQGKLEMALQPEAQSAV
jgi:hypothetical protein